MNIIFSHILLNANVDGCSSALEYALSNFVMSTPPVKTLRLLLSTTEKEANIGFYRGSAEGFSLCQQALDPLYYQRSLEDRVATAIQLANRYNVSETLRLSLARGPLPPLPPSIVGGSGRSLLSIIALGMGQFFLCGWEQREQSEDYIAEISGINPEEATAETEDLLTIGV